MKRGEFEGDIRDNRRNGMHDDKNAPKEGYVAQDGRRGVG